MTRFLVFLALVVAVGCVSETPSSDTPASSESVSASESTPTDEPSAEFDATAELFVIDVRSESEWELGHVDRAVHIPHTEITERISDVTTDKDAKIVLYCAVGGRAGKAKTALESMGYTNVENAGGFDDVKDRFQDE